MPDNFKSPERQADGSVEMTDTEKPGIEEICDALESFQSDPSRRARIGHIGKLTVAGEALTPDLQLSNPMWANLVKGKPADYPKVTGVITKVTWAGGKTDPITFEFLVSAANWQLATGVEYEEDEGAEDDQTFEPCEVSFVVYDYDPLAKLVYKCFHSNDVEVEGEFRFNEADYDVAITAYEGIRSPQLYAMKLVVKPKLKVFSLFVGLGDRATITKGWGDASIKARQAAQQADEARKQRAIDRIKARDEKARQQQEAVKQRDQKAQEKTRAKEVAAQKAKKEKDDAAARSKRIADVEAEQERLVAQAEQAAKVALDLARAAEQAHDEAALAAARKDALEKTVAAALAEKARVGSKFEQAKDGIEEEYDKAKRAYDADERKETKEAEKAAVDAERSVWEAAIALDAARRKLLDSKFEAEVALGAARSAAAKKKAEAEIERLDAELLALELKRVDAESARRQHGPQAEQAVKAASDEREAAARAFRKEFDDRILDAAEAARLEMAPAEKRRLEAEEALRLLRKSDRDREKADFESKLRIEATQQKSVAQAVEARARAVEVTLMRGVAACTSAAARAATAATHAERLWGEITLGLAKSEEAVADLEMGVEALSGSAWAVANAIASHEFGEHLSITLKLTLGTAIHEIPGGTVTHLSIDAHTYGFTGEIELLLAVDDADDTLMADFTGQKLGEVELAVKSKFQPEKEPPDPLKLKGVILRRRVREETFDDALATVKVLLRRYSFTFADPAAALWKQHFPCELYADQTLQQVIDLQKGGKITITGDWASHLGAAKPIIFLSLGDERGGASFYDFLIWYLDRNIGVLHYDMAKNEYAILGAKPSGAKTRKLERTDVEELAVRFPEVPRYAVNVLNGWSEATTKKTAITFDDAVTGIRQDPLMRTEIASRFEDRGKVETARLVARRPELQVHFVRWPTVTFAPGEIIDFSHATWAATAFQKSKSYRVRRYRIDAYKSGSGSEASEGSTFGLYDLSVEAVLEEKGETAPHLPPYTTPVYPSFVEAKIVAVGGVDEDRTFLIVDDKKTSISYYKVDVKLWNKKIPAHFHPGQVPGHFFFPGYKHERVLIALDLFSAEIKRFLDWAPRGQLPIDTQGNHLLLGKRETDETSIRHTYVDAKAVFTIERLKAGDTQVMTLSDGLLSMLVKADANETTAPPKFDVTMQVESAKGDLQMQGGGAVADVSGQLGGALAGPTGALSGAQDAISGELGGMSAELGADIGAVKGELEGKLGGLGKAGEELDAEVGAAIAEIEKAMQ